MVLIQKQLLDELYEVVKRHPDMYVGDVIDMVLNKYHPTRHEPRPYYMRNLSAEKYPASNSIQLDALHKYNKHQSEIK